MRSFPAKDCLFEVVGLRNDIINQVFRCPDCGHDVTISVWQAAGELDIMCGRCNTRWRLKDGQALSPEGPSELHIGRAEKGRPSEMATGYQVMTGLDATQKAAPIPRDSWLTQTRPDLAPPKPTPAAPVQAPQGGATGA